MAKQNYRHLAVKSTKEETNFAKRAAFKIQGEIDDFITEQGMSRGNQEVDVYVVLLPSNYGEKFLNVKYPLTMEAEFKK